jgi:hypothetical protein
MFILSGVNHVAYIFIYQLRNTYIADYKYMHACDLYELRVKWTSHISLILKYSTT